MPGNHDGRPLQKIFDVAAAGQKGRQIPNITEQIQVVSLLVFWHRYVIPQECSFNHASAMNRPQMVLAS